MTAPEASPQKSSIMTTVAKFAWWALSRSWKWIKDLVAKSQEKKLRIKWTTTDELEIVVPNGVDLKPILIELKDTIHQRRSVKSLPNRD
jgi:hypothetical protein